MALHSKANPGKKREWGKILLLLDTLRSVAEGTRESTK